MGNQFGRMKFSGLGHFFIRICFVLGTEEAATVVSHRIAAFFIALY